MSTKVNLPADAKVTPANASFAAYIRAAGFDISDEQVQLTSIFHREWQASAGRKAELAAARAEKDAEKARKEQERADARAEKDDADEKRLQDALRKIAERKAQRSDATA
jgi:hypothetical protein